MHLFERNTKVEDKMYFTKESLDVLILETLVNL